MRTRTGNVLLSVALLFPGLASGQNIIHGPLVSNITHSSARVTFVTDANPSRSEVEYGRLGLDTVVVAVNRNQNQPFTSLATLTGLSPGTTYRLRGRVSEGLMTSDWVTFTTSPEPALHPAPPIEPIPVNTSMPPGPYGDSSELQVSEDCSNLTDVLEKLAGLNGDLNYEVVIPAGAECRGRFTFPIRPNHQGWIVVRSSAVGGQSFPPEGVRWTQEWQGTTAKFITNILPVYSYNQPPSVPNKSCLASGAGEGGLYWTTQINKTVFPILQCSDSHPPYEGPAEITNITGNITMTITAPGHRLQPGDVIMLSENGYTSKGGGGQTMVQSVDGDKFTVRPLYRQSLQSVFDPNLKPTFTRNPYWRSPPYRPGTELPESCQQEEWFHNPQTGAVYWCTAPNQWREFVGDYPWSYKHAAITVPRGAARYRFIGLEITHRRMPDPLPKGWEKPVNGKHSQGTVLELVESRGDQVIWDRCYVHGYPYPQRLSYGIVWGGKNIGIINSSLDEMAWWRAGSPSQLEHSIGILHWEHGPAIVDNNFLAVAGMTYFVPDTGGNLPHDVTFSRNYLKMYRKWRQGDGENNGRVYTNRNSWELKQGWVHKIEGNTFDYNFSNLTIGVFLLLTPRCVPLGSPVKIEAASGGVITTNQPSNYKAGDVIYITDTNSNYDGLWEVYESGCPENCNKIKLMNGPVGTAQGGSAWLRARNTGIRDILVQYNRFLSGTEVLRVAGFDAACSSSSLPPTSRVAVLNNETNDLNIRSFDQGGHTDRGGIYGTFGSFGPRAVFSLGLLEDLIVRNNRFIGNRGKMPHLFAMEKVSEGLDFSNNVFTFDESIPLTAVSHGGSAFGAEALNRGYKRDGESHWKFENNVICCGRAGYAPQYPSTTRWPESIEEIGNYRQGKQDETLVASLQPMLPGVAADDRKFELEMAARQGRVLEVKSRSTGRMATLSYIAPDANACTVEFGASPVFGTGKRLSDGGGPRDRVVELNGLHAGMTVHYRVLCAAEQPAGTIAVQ